MIQIFEGAQWANGLPILDGMYRDRKKIFVDLLGWDVPVVDGAYEIDQFDDEHAIYVVATNEKCEDEGSIQQATACPREYLSRTVRRRDPCRRKRFRAQSRLPVATQQGSASAAGSQRRDDGSRRVCIVAGN